MPLAPYNGKTDLRAYMAQFDHLARGNGWSVDESGTHLVAALHSAVAGVLTTMPPGGITLAGLRLTLNNRFGVEQQSELVKAQLSGRKRQPHEKMGDLAYDIRHTVGIAPANMAPLYQEDLALDYFIQVLAGTDTGALLTTFRPESLQKAADAAARWEAAKPPA